MASKKTTRFRNTSGGYVGAVRIKANGEEVGISIDPHGFVDLTDDEIEATAKAPAKAKDNPFVDQPFEVYDQETGEVTETGRRPLLVPDVEQRHAPVAGVRGGTEEVGTPAATKAGGRRRTPAKTTSRAKARA